MEPQPIDYSQNTQKPALVSSIRTQASIIRGYPIEDIISRQALGEMNFDDVRNDLAHAQQMTTMLLSSEIELLPASVLIQLDGQTHALVESIDKMQSFKISEGKARHDEIRGEVLRNLDAFLKLCIQYGSIFIYPSAQDAINKANQIAQQLKQSVAESLRISKERVEAIEGLYQAAQMAAGRVGVERHSTNFGQRATKHFWLSVAWLVAIAATVTAIICVAIYFMTHAAATDTLTTAALAQKLLAKAMLISALYYLLVLSARNFRANQHLVVVNRHRQTALETFQTFVKNTDDAQTKNAVLLEATRTIFAPTSTGHLGGDDDPQGSRFIEIILKTLGKGADK